MTDEEKKKALEEARADADFIGSIYECMEISGISFTDDQIIERHTSVKAERATKIVDLTG